MPHEREAADADDVASSAAIICRYSAAWTLGGISTGTSGDTAGPLSAVPSGAN